MAEKITAETRTEFGKGAARRIRRADKVPAVIYGHGNEPIHIALPGHDAMMALKHGGANALLEIEIDGTTQLGLTKQVQVDPITRFLEHVDFVAVKKGEKVTVDVPVHLVGEAGPDTLRPPTSPSTSKSPSRVPASAPRSSLPSSTCRPAPRCSPTTRR
jgi:large subunit ribosomal protein L25